MARFVALLVVVSLGLGACEDDPDSTLSIHVPENLVGLGEFSGLVITVADRTLTGADFAPRPNSSLFEARIAVPNRGILEVGVSLGEEGREIAAGSLRREMQPGTSWLLRLIRSTRDPADSCFGCIATEEIPLLAEAQRSPGEALWAVWAVDRGGEVVFSPTAASRLQPSIPLSF